MSTYPPRSRGEKALAWVRDHSPVLESYRDDYADFRDPEEVEASPFMPSFSIRARL